MAMMFAITTSWFLSWNVMVATALSLITDSGHGAASHNNNNNSPHQHPWKNFAPSITTTGSNHHLLSILFENDRILAIDKPAGISHHDDDNGDSVGSQQQQQQQLGILSYIRQLQSAGHLEYTGRLYGVHRLDRVTSGILLLAKDASMASQLTRAFREGRVTKYYVGLSHRKPAQRKQGWIRGNMVRGRCKTWYLTPTATTTMKATTIKSSTSKQNNNDNHHQDESSSQQPPSDKNNDNSNMAITRFFTAGLGNLSSQTTSLDVSPPPPRTCILFRPYTGKTHQLRVAAKAVGLALAGDPLYRDGSAVDSDFLAVPRTCLHAAGLHVQLTTDHHDDGTPINFPVTIWSQPPFGSLFWNDTKSHGANEFDQVVERLMDKHCDCSALRELLHLAPR